MSEFKFGQMVEHPVWGVCVFIRYTPNAKMDGVLPVIASDDGEQYYCQPGSVTPHTPPPPEGTVPVRIAVATYADGKWSAWGCQGCHDDDAVGMVRESLPMGEDCITWINTYAYLPAAPTEVNATPEVSDEDR